jgi:hypothetical protein
VLWHGGHVGPHQARASSVRSVGLAGHEALRRASWLAERKRSHRTGNNMSVSDTGRCRTAPGGMADEFRGWSGRRNWRNGVGRLGIEATHDGLGHVILRFRLRDHLHKRRPSAASTDGSVLIASPAVAQAETKSQMKMRVSPGPMARPAPRSP